MKLKFLKFVLPILLVLPSFAFGITIEKNKYLYGEDIVITDCVYAGNWGSAFMDANLTKVFFPYMGWYSEGSVFNDGSCQYLPWHLSRHLSFFPLPIGRYSLIEIPDTLECFDICYDYGYEQCKNNCAIDEAIFDVVAPTIGNTQNWLSQNEILAHIGKLAEDIPNYIALMIGLPISFWFIEKTIAFVRGNFRPVEKIKKE